jgi:hypothetical protein
MRMRPYGEPGAIAQKETAAPFGTAVPLDSK